MTCPEYPGALLQLRHWMYFVRFGNSTVNNNPPSPVVVLLLFPLHSPPRHRTRKSRRKKTRNNQKKYLKEKKQTVGREQERIQVTCVARLVRARPGECVGWSVGGRRGVGRAGQSAAYGPTANHSSSAPFVRSGSDRTLPRNAAAAADGFGATASGRAARTHAATAVRVAAHDSRRAAHRVVSVVFTGDGSPFFSL